MKYNISKFRKLSRPRNENSKRRFLLRHNNRELYTLLQNISLLMIDYMHNTNTTQIKLAEQMGIPVEYVSRLINGGENILV